MKCWHCNSELMWSSDFSYEDYGVDGEGTVAVLICSNKKCNAYVESYLDLEQQVK